MTRYIIDSDGQHIPEGTKEFEQIVGEWASDKSFDRARRAWRTRAEFQLQAKLEARKERDEWKARAEKAEFRLNFLETAGEEAKGWCEHERRYQRTSGGDGDHCYLCELAETKARADAAEAALAEAHKERDLLWRIVDHYLGCVYGALCDTEEVRVVARRDAHALALALKLVERTPDGTPHIRDVDSPCEDYEPGSRVGSERCDGDGHYLCREGCRHFCDPEGGER